MISESSTTESESEISDSDYESETSGIAYNVNVNISRPTIGDEQYRHGREENYQREREQPRHQRGQQRHNRQQRRMLKLNSSKFMFFHLKHYWLSIMLRLPYKNFKFCWILRERLRPPMAPNRVNNLKKL